MISIYKGNTSNNVHVTSKHNFFEQDITYKIKDGCIYLKRFEIDDIKNVIHPVRDKRNGHYHFFITTNDEEIEFKKYEFDEDSNEDLKIVYYRYK